jgi:hypothetical protein
MQSAALWLNPPQYKHLPGENIFVLYSTEIFRLHALKALASTLVFPTNIPAEAPVGLIGGLGCFGEVLNLAFRSRFCAPFLAHYWVIWLPRFCHTITYAGNSSSKLRYVKKFFS